MSEIVKLLSVLVVFFVLIGIAWFAAWKLGLIKPLGNRGESSPKKSGARPTSYAKKSHLLTDGERAFWPVLQQALPLLAQSMGKKRLPLVFAHVHFADLVTPETSTHAARNAVNQKHVDFLLCNPETTEPLLVIELDDASHTARKQIVRDSVKDGACQSAGLGILRVPAASKYDATQLALDMHRVLTSTKPTRISTPDVVARSSG